MAVLTPALERITPEMLAPFGFIVQSSALCNASKVQYKELEWHIVLLQIQEKADFCLALKERKKKKKKKSFQASPVPAVKMWQAM